MKFDITSIYNSVDILYLKDDIKKQDSVYVIRSADMQTIFEVVEY